jgi:hypothetical protein
VFKLGTKQPVSVNRVTEISVTEAKIKIVNNIGECENQPEGIEFSDINGRITLSDFTDNANDDDSNASDDDFEMDKEYEQELNDEIVMEEEEGSIGNDDPDSQEDYLQTPIEQHNTSVKDNNEIASAVVRTSRRTNINPIVTLSNTAPLIQERNKRKK